MKSLPVRVISAVVLLIILFGTYWFFQISGLYILGTAVCVGAVMEFKNIAFPNPANNILSIWFAEVAAVALVASSYLAYTGQSVWLPTAWLCTMVIFICGALWLHAIR